MRRGHLRPTAFTLIELLVVVAIIALLVSILMPSLKKAKDLARDAACRVSMKNIALAMQIFARDHSDIMPAQGWNRSGDATKPWTNSSWIGNEIFDPNWPMDPGVKYYADLYFGKPGTLLPYVGGAGAARRLYRCPGLMKGAYGKGVGSNGMFDYDAPLEMSGVKPDLISMRSRVRDPILTNMMPVRNWNDGQWKTVPPPLVVECAEDNQNNALWTLPEFNGGSSLGAWHPVPKYSCNFGGMDGSSIHLTWLTSEGAQSERSGAYQAGVSAHLGGDWLVRTAKGLEVEFQGWDGYGYLNNN